MKVLSFSQHLIAVKRYCYLSLYGLVLSLIFTNCDSAAVEVTIVNATPEDLGGIEVSNNKNEITTGRFELKAGEEMRKQLSFSTVSPTDGHYVLRIDQHAPRDFGYYSNGIPLESKIEIEVRKDTVLIKME